MTAADMQCLPGPALPCFACLVSLRYLAALHNNNKQFEYSWKNKKFELSGQLIQCWSVQTDIFGDEYVGLSLALMSMLNNAQ